MFQVYNVMDGQFYGEVYLTYEECWAEFHDLQYHKLVPKGAYIVTKLQD